SEFTKALVLLTVQCTESAFFRLRDVQMNIFANLNHMGVFFKEEPVRQLHAAIEKAGNDVVYPVDD
ncbi:hypothetical protein, partial [Vibrio cholerae]|uniref:hypothetical protein n=1 Tax=Vibrio cholerae TaxID=666 RepID=UPI0039C9DDA7